MICSKSDYIASGREVRGGRFSVRGDWLGGGCAWPAASAFTILALLTAMLSTPAALAGGMQREEFRRDFQKTVPLAAGQSLRLDHRNGDILIHTHTLPEVQIKATIRVSASSKEDAASYGNQITIDVQQTPESVVVRTQYPERQGSFLFGRRNISYAVDYGVAMPETSPLQVTNRFGNVTSARTAA